MWYKVGPDALSETKDRRIVSLTQLKGRPDPNNRYPLLYPRSYLLEQFGDWNRFYPTLEEA